LAAAGGRSSNDVVPPCGRHNPSQIAANRCMKAMNQVGKAAGSSSRNSQLNVSWRLLS
jgi:hypothetical protein